MILNTTKLPSGSYDLIAVVVKRGDEYRIKKHDTGKLLPQHYKSRDSAERALRAMQMYKRKKLKNKKVQSSNIFNYRNAISKLVTAAYILESASDGESTYPASKQELHNEWDKVKPLFDELKSNRSKKVPVESLKLKPNGGVSNIISVYNEATEEEKEYWGHWYLYASNVVFETTRRYDVDFVTAAGVYAVLSPGNKWFMNARIADKLIFFWKNDALDIIGPLSGYPRNVEKAINILNGASPAEVLNTPKVGVFFDSLVDPEGVQREIVLDSHAMNIWWGVKRSIKQTPAPSDDLRLRMENDYKKAAKMLGLGPDGVQALQATTWFIWQAVTKKRLKK